MEHNKLPQISKDVGRRPISSLSLQADDDDDDPETEMIMPFPDEWMASYLQIKRLRYLERRSYPPPELPTQIWFRAVGSGLVWVDYNIRG
jgi:hypothetical protein